MVENNKVATNNSVQISFVIPVYNEEEVLQTLFSRMEKFLSQIKFSAEIILVNDGSYDSSLEIIKLKARQDSRYRIINLSRNFGHQIAITAGLDNARGQAAIIIDADLQDPPEVALEMIKKWQDGYNIVHAKRIERHGEKFIKRFTAKAFYRVLSFMSPIDIPENVGDFRLIDRVALDALKGMPERDRFVRGMVGWLGLKQTNITYAREKRVAGKTKYPLFKMLQLATNGILGFSDTPLRVVLWTGLIVSAFAFLYGGIVVIRWLFRDQLVEGWTSTIVVLSMLGSINLLVLGIIGLYVGRIHNEVKRRPLYIIYPESNNRSDINNNSQQSEIYEFT